MRKNGLIIALIILAAGLRLIPHMPNVAPIAALALLSGVTLRRPWSLIVPLVAMLASDIFIGFDTLPITLSVYASFALTVVIGQWLARQKNPMHLLSASFVSSSLFFIITNAAVWQFSKMYPPTITGLGLSYYYGLPFFRNTLLGDLLWTVTLFLAVAYGPQIARLINYSHVTQVPGANLMGQYAQRRALRRSL